MATPATSRQFGVFVATAIVIANMIGTGVFTSAGYQAAALHDPHTMLLTWIVGGVVALCGAAAYAELGALMPKAGGEYVYLREAYHPAVGFMSGWVSLTAGFSAPIAATALAFASYVATLSPAAAGAQKLVATALIVGVTLLHAFNSALGGKAQAVLTTLKVTLILLFIGAGIVFGYGDTAHFTSTAGGLSKQVPTTQFAISLMYVGFAYSGWNAAAYIAGEIKDPERNLPRALIAGTAFVMVLYIAINAVFIYAVAPADLGNFGGKGPVQEVGDVAGRALFGQRAGAIFTTAISLALVSTVSAMVMAGPRVYASMAADHALPNWLAIRSTNGVPYVAVIAQAVLGTAFVWLVDFRALMEYVGFWLSLSAALTVFAVFVMRRRGARSAYRTFGYPVTPLLFIALSLWSAYAKLKDAIHAYSFELALSAGTLLGGTVLYILMSRRRQQP